MRRDAQHCRSRRETLCHDRAGTDDNVIAQLDTWQDNGVRADPTSLAYSNRQHRIPLHAENRRVEPVLGEIFCEGMVLWEQGRFCG